MYPSNAVPRSRNPIVLISPSFGRRNPSDGLELKPKKVSHVSSITSGEELLFEFSEGKNSNKISSSTCGTCGIDSLEESSFYGGLFPCESILKLIDKLVNICL